MFKRDRTQPKGSIRSSGRNIYLPNVERVQSKSKRGIIIHLIWGPLFIIALAEDLNETVDVVLVTFFTLLVAYLVGKNIIKYRTTKLVTTYLRYLDESETNTIGELAQRLGTDVKTVKKNLERFEKYELVFDVVIDADGVIEVNGSDGRSLIRTLSEKADVVNDYLNQAKEIFCPACGAANEVIAGQYSHCAYCGTKLDT